MTFQQGLSGLDATSRHLDAIGHSIASSGVFGTKALRADHSDGRAHALHGVGADFRNGPFKVDGEGFIVNDEGQQLLGYPADGMGLIQRGHAVPLRLATPCIGPSDTDQIGIKLNLDARARVTLPATAPAIVFSDARTYNNAASLTVHDASGKDIALAYYFQKAASDRWNLYVTANGVPVSADPLGNPTATAQLRFLAQGGTPMEPSGFIAFDIPASINSHGAQTLPLTGVRLHVTGVTQYASSFGVSDMAQNGCAPGHLSRISIEADGIVMARYSNGQSRPAGQIMLPGSISSKGVQPIRGSGWSRIHGPGDA